METLGDWGGDEGKYGRIVYSESKEKQMKRLSIPLRLVFTILAITLLAACAPGEVTPSPVDVEATVNAAVAQTMEAQGQIATSVALTVAAQAAETAAAQPTATPVPAEPLPLPTLTPILPTATPFTVASSGGGGGGGSGGSASAEYSCDPDIRKRPFDNTEFHRKDTFDVIFTIKNTGTKTWDAGKDLVLLGNPGSTLSIPTGFVVELPKMEPGDLFTVGPFDAQAPDDPGHYVVDFKLEGGFCYPYVAFNVVR
jgi:Ig-like domain from next to BRCA1 gene